MINEFVEPTLGLNCEVLPQPLCSSVVVVVLERHEVDGEQRAEQCRLGPRVQVGGDCE